MLLWQMFVSCLIMSISYESMRTTYAFFNSCLFSLDHVDFEQVVSFYQMHQESNACWKRLDMRVEWAVEFFADLADCCGGIREPLGRQHERDITSFHKQRDGLKGRIDEKKYSLAN